jgi:hypothetical protein
MEQYLDSVSLEKIEEVRHKLILKKQGLLSGSSDSDDASLSEDNWEFLMIHTSKRVEEHLEMHN